MFAEFHPLLSLLSKKVVSYDPLQALFKYQSYHNVDYFPVSHQPCPSSTRSLSPNVSQTHHPCPFNCQCPRGDVSYVPVATSPISPWWRQLCPHGDVSYVPVAMSAMSPGRHQLCQQLCITNRTTLAPKNEFITLNTRNNDETSLCLPPGG